MWVPIRVIKHSYRKLAVVDMPSNLRHNYSGLTLTAGIFMTPEERKVVGQFELDLTEFRKLKAAWGKEKITLLCGTDGGLKDGIGSTGYVITDPTADKPLLMGGAAEKQDLEEASSTRQELLAQLAVVYWLDHLIQVIGEPCEEVDIHLVTDSQASIDILGRCTQNIGIKDVMKPERDVSEALKHRRDKLQRIRYTVIKVRSHITKDEADNESHWEINQMADTLATEARSKALRSELRITEPMLFEGVKAGCMRRGRIITGALKREIQTALYEAKLKHYLSLKHGWPGSVMEAIDWTAHKKVVESTPITQRVTLMKYIHGWLATKKSRYRQGVFNSAKCFFCPHDEDGEHIFRCTHETNRLIRKRAVEKLLHRMGGSTDPVALQVLRCGIGSITDGTDMRQYAQEFLTNSSYQTLVMEQTEIGWVQLLFGRAARKWRVVGPKEGYTKDGLEWTKLLVREILQYGITLWKNRNQMVHGNQGNVSLAAATYTSQMVESLYLRIAPWAPTDTQWLFQTALQDRLREPYGLQVAWIDGIRRVFPEEYREIQGDSGRYDMLSNEIEFILHNQSGLAG